MKKITSEKFVEVWESSANLKEVCRRLSKIQGEPYSQHVASSRASMYRNQGVELKTMKGGRTSLQVNKLNGIVQKNRQSRALSK